MTNHEIFILPGYFLLEFILSVLGVDPADMSEESARVLSFLLAGLFWAQVVSIAIALIKKKFGFYNGGPQR